MEQPIADRFSNYSEKHCFQKQIRIENLEEDIDESGLTLDEIKRLRISDFTFSFISKEDKETYKECESFIKRHEWLGKTHNRTTHVFTARYKSTLAGVVMMTVPNSFSHLLGEDKKNLEKLIARGACISWSPKNLASSLIMYSIKWMVKNTEFRVFTAYSDPEARELGSIYQACNFIYLGQKYGADKLYYDPTTPQLGWFNSRRFRHRSMYKKYAKELGISWQKNWIIKDRLVWNNIPDEIEQMLRQASKDYMARCDVRKTTPKHKYVYILGKDKREHKKLIKEFCYKNPKLVLKDQLGLDYPKERGV